MNRNAQVKITNQHPLMKELKLKRSLELCLDDVSYFQQLAILAGVGALAVTFSGARRRCFSQRYLM